MTKQEILRAWLCDNGFQFLADEIVREGRLYQVLTVRFNGKSTQLTEAELYCGKYDVLKVINLTDGNLLSVLLYVSIELN